MKTQANSKPADFLPRKSHFLSKRVPPVPLGARRPKAARAVLFLAVVLVLPVFASVVVACGSGSESNTASQPSETTETVKIRLLTHDSFAISDEVWQEFKAQTGIEVEVVRGKDTGFVASQIILTKDNPVADVVFGIDNTFLTSVLNEDVFEPYVSEVRAHESLYAGTQGQVTPIDFGDVCVNYWVDELEVEPPQTLADLADERYKGLFVTQNPETSSPGLAFLLATIAYFGEDGWEDFWRQLRDNEVRVTSGWTEAYYTNFTAGGGEYPIVTSYASSPVAEVIFADPPVAEPPTAIIADSCFRQVEYAGILAGSDNISASQQLIDFMLSDTFQQDIPLNMFVFPASPTAQLPDVFAQHAIVPENSLSLSPELIAEKKNEWTERWTEIVLR